MLNLLQPYFLLILEIDYPVVWLSALKICGSLLVIVIIFISQIFLVWNVGVIVCVVFACSIIAIISDAHTGWWFITTSKDLAIEILWAKSWSQTYLSTSRLVFWNVELVLYYGLFNGLQIFGSVNTIRQYFVGISTQRPSSGPFLEVVGLSNLQVFWLIHLVNTFRSIKGGLIRHLLFLV